MDEQTAQMRAVTISREYGSGGGEIARRLTKRLQWQLVDHEIVVRTAREMGITEAEAQEQDERGESLAVHLLNSMRMVYPTMYTLAPDQLLTNEQSYSEALSHVVRAAVATGHVVIVGRGSQVLLANQQDVLHVRIIAPFEQRVAYVMQREGLGHDAAKSRVLLKDSDRNRYLQSQHHEHPDDPHLYDLLINTGVLSLDSAAELIQMALQAKASQLGLVREQLGPGAGLAPYPGQPGDIRPP